MPESPEVQALAEELATRLVGHALTGVDVLEFRTTKTRGRAPESLVGESVTGVVRHGKLLDLAFSTQHLVVSLGRHGWARWGAMDVAAGEAQTQGAAEVPADAPVPSPTLVTLTFDDGSALEFTDAGDWVSLGLWIVDDPAQVPAVAKLGPDPADPTFSRREFDAAMVGRRKQVKAVLQEQESLAGIGNAYSDEILHSAQVSPVAHAASLDADALDRLFQATVATITGAISDRRGVPIADLKATKVAAMRVHGRAGETCPVCGGTIRDFTFAGTTAQYCPDCQTGGELLPLK
ncbi:MULTISPECIES: DNA-formamidopyrimidine glycosylase family protein [unclassified Leifsonia]|uniref:DNA-formamidopyrimidine glycosylase family protein n=1 Tax=unclassified Leifsonia TaxID=2663824 RepID=UPI0006FBA3F3|nr:MULTISPECIES: DNA-formamidopyrimidine glycosylase family protein [unclassified Leifsonia]KQX07437.1 formamidopyrimidine-DNA glycosylase [Leifsonia sp. Root1293]KRA11719.1 formamidopyrimidine-DNA glycosylase [Leifsonia sp. Root60]